VVTTKKLNWYLLNSEDFVLKDPVAAELELITEMMQAEQEKCDKIAKAFALIAYDRRLVLVRKMPTLSL
jgi:hypothetical protein